MNLKMQPFKKGPDYIDPLWLGAAAGRTCHNPDAYMESADAKPVVFLQCHD